MNRFYEDLIRQMEQDFERNEELLRRFLHSFTSPERFWEPQVDIYETREAVKVKVELAGVKPEGITVELGGDGRTLAIRGMREDERSRRAPPSSDGSNSSGFIGVRTAPVQMQFTRMLSGA